MHTVQIRSATDDSHAAASRQRRGGFFCVRVPQEAPSAIAGAPCGMVGSDG